MSSLSVVLQADTSGFSSAIKSAKDLLEQYTQKNKELSDAIKKNSDVNDQQVNAYKRVIKQLSKVDSGTLSTTQSQKVLVNQIQELKMQWQNLSQEAKNSDFGKSISASMKSAEKQLKQLRTQMKDVSGDMEQSSDKVDKLAGKLGGDLVSSITSLAGRFAVVTTTLKVLKDAFMATETGADNWGKAVAGAESAYKVFLTTLNNGDWSNFFRNLNNAIGGAMDLYDKLDRLNSIKTNNQAAIAIVEQELSKLRLQKQQGKNVDEEIKRAEARLLALRNQEIEEGQKAGRDQIIQAIQQQNGGISEAIAGKFADMILKNGQIAYDVIDKKLAELEKKATVDAVVNITSPTGITQSFTKPTIAVEKLTESERQLYYALKAVHDAEGDAAEGIATYTNAVKTATQANQEAFKYNKWGGNTANNSNKTEYKVDTQQIRNDYYAALHAGNTEAARDLSIQLSVAIKNKGTFKSIEEFKEKLQEEFNRVAKSQNQFDIETDIDIKPVEINVNTDSAALAALKKEYEELKRQLEKDPLNVELQIKIQDIENDIKLIEQNPVQVETELYIPENSLKGLQNRLKELQAELEITVDPEAIKEILEDITNVQGKIDSILMTSQDRFNTMIDGISDVNSASQNLYRTWLNLDETLSNIDTNFVDKMFAISDAILQTVESITTAVDAFQSMIQIIKQTQAAQNAATQQKISQNAAEAASNTATTTTSLSKAASDTFAAHAKIPFAGIAIAIGLIASMMAIMSSIKGFASGGIVQGKNTIGDYNLIRVNSGEAVLNKSQQNRLFRILNGELSTGAGNNMSGNVEFHIEGSQLVGVLNNYTRRKSKI